MKALILIFLFSSPSFALDEKVILEQLMGIHGANWGAVAKTESDYKDIKNALFRVITGDLDLAQYGYVGDVTVDLVQSATSEYGNFVGVNSQGQINDEDKILIERLKSSLGGEPSSHDSLAFYELLKNSGTAEGLDILSEGLLETENLSTLYTIQRSLHQGLAGENKGTASQDLDHSYINYYRPNITKTWRERPGDWKTILKKIKSRVSRAEEVVKQRSQDERFIKSFSELKNKIFEISKKENQDKRQVLIPQSTKIDPKSPDPKKQMKREVSSVEAEEKDKLGTKIPWSFVIFAVLLFFLFRKASRN